MSEISIYKDIALRTDGDIYLGVVGPVRTGKSTFIKRFMETLVIPRIDNVYRLERARDELPQSGSGRTIMTAEPKFIPEEAVTVALGDGGEVSVRLIDCVGYMVEGAAGQFEDGTERMVTTPWFDHEITLTEAAEKGTEKVITDHSTLGIVVTCDGSICDIPRDAYLNAEERVIRELKSIGKPFAVILNSTEPKSGKARDTAREISERYGVSCLSLNCLELGEEEIKEILRAVLYDFPAADIGFCLPSWVEALSRDHPLRAQAMASIRNSCRGIDKLRDVETAAARISAEDGPASASVKCMRLGTGSAELTLDYPRALYYETISRQSGFPIENDGDLMTLLTQMKEMKGEYDRISQALRDVREHGYAIVPPTPEEMKLDDPEIVRQGGRYGVRLKASAPSIHMIMANIETEVSPALGGERASEEIINFLLQGFEGDTKRLWESNIFGKSLYDIAGEGVLNKLRKMPPNAQAKLQQTLTRIVNDGAGSLICIII